MLVSITGACLCLAVHLRMRLRRDKVGPRVVVASKAAAKLQSARKAFETSEVTGMSAESGISDQPIGLEQILIGAKNRMRSVTSEALAASAATQPYDFAVACENGIVKLTDEEGAEKWLDLAIVAVRDLRTGDEALASSAGVELSTETVGDWVEAGANDTVGAWLAQETGCNKQDPHAFLTRGEFSRAKLLEDAIRLALTRLPAK
eukprot:CAMPEP_0119316984 /NCGR_PEP_ID=MMETSP1333-20130426/41545_1 /TAXON_ID=418940 /ORGANISM="Scyphosphaera apsteinii, Strain RCC1455" /LENGTH=204 /DNA_ID=CAMNT_0007322779 /DNA_START=82 /DNA_END=696 /DNA_ORIENTATION=-